MEIIAFICLAIAAVISLVYGIILMIKAFQVSIWWGAGLFIYPLRSTDFYRGTLADCQRPFLKKLDSYSFHNHRYDFAT